jgi:protein SCO1/2
VRRDLTQRATPSTSRLAPLALVVACLAGPLVVAQEIANPPAPHELAGVGISEKPNAELPLGVRLTDDTGAPVTLERYFQTGRPVILTLNYYSCPMLCTLVLNGLVESLKAVEFEPSTDYEIVTISIDPRDDARIAGMKKANYAASLGRPGGAAGWHFLTGPQDQVKQVADAVGFSYRWVEERKEWAHAAAIFVITPDGHVSRYLYGVQFDPQTVRLSLAEAADGKIGTALDQLLLFCFHYDSAAGRYTVAATNFVRLGGLLTMLTLGILLLRFWRIELRRRRMTPVTGQ